jgi:hypothetical protein
MVNSCCHSLLINAFVPSSQKPKPQENQLLLDQNISMIEQTAIFPIMQVK